MTRFHLPNWKHFALSTAFAYLPFLAMAIYMTLFVACSHCKQAAWMLFPVGPGVVPVELAFREFAGHRPSDAMLFACGVVAAALVAFIPAMFYRRRAARFAVIALQLIASSIAALGLMAAIRA